MTSQQGICKRLSHQIGGSEFRTQLLRGGIGSVAVKAGNAVLAFAVAVVLARTLGPEGYGVYSFALAVLMFTAIPAQVGVPQLLVRETAKAQADGNYELMRGLWRWGDRAVLLFSVLALAVVGAVVLLTDIGRDGARVTTLTVALPLIPLLGLANARGACLRGLRNVVQGQLPESIIRPAMLLVLIGIGGRWVDAGQLGAQIAMAFHVTAAIVAFVVGFVLLKRAQPAQLVVTSIPECRIETWCRAVMPLALIAALQLINNYADLIFLGIFRSDQEVGVYRAVMQLAIIVAAGLHIMGKVIQPYIAALYRESNREKLQRLASASTLIVSVFALTGVVIFAIVGEEVLAAIYGADYSVGWRALWILCIGKAFYAIMGLAWHILIMTGFERNAVNAALLTSAINVFLNFLLVPRFGMEGAATATMISFLVFSLLLHRQVKLKTGLAMFRFRWSWK